VISPQAFVPDAVTVAVSLNGQQFINDKTLHIRDIENTFTYLQKNFLYGYGPKMGPTIGRTKITVQGVGFNQIKADNGTKVASPLWVRLVDETTGNVVGKPSLAIEQTNDEFSWITPAGPENTMAIMQFSYNNVDWEQILPENQTYSYKYYNAPVVNKVTPPYGPVKSPNDEKVEIQGSNFAGACTAPCKDLVVRFGEGENSIAVKG
jgi:hypothetical protein